ncbi:amidohydrolase [Micromonospora zingiberis]|uniref:Amidohydrolase n=1 Tax=Micromonospora zingiberis TaxID=2053011 RepID=A0A4R0GBG7_9ACTN|nr:Atu4866 domain-containing protein [Micromonospora zingiberis]TCB93372.1 amidohydrolase [Micromonospora zingiberis]
MTDVPDTFTAADLQAVRTGTGRPLLLTDATVHTLDPVIGTMKHADVLIGGGLVVGVGPGIVNAADDDGAVVVRAAGTTIVPGVVDLSAVSMGARRGEGPGTLAPGAPAHLAVLADTDAPDLDAALRAALTGPERLRAVLRDGMPVVWDGTVLTPASQPDATTDAEGGGAGHVDPERVGVWVDTEDFLHQELTADGRYDETRGGRRHAFQGRYWIDGDRIDYLDDLGFWAFGRFDGDTLHHAGYTMHRRQTR